MKQIPFAGKALSVAFTAALLAACAGTDTQPEDTVATDPPVAGPDPDEVRQQEEMDRQRQNEERLRADALAAGTVFYFDYDSSVLKPLAQEALDAHIALLRTNNTGIRLEGHTDERGTRDYNIALGERRANAVRDYMVVNGIASYRIETVSYGEEQPVAYGSNESSWSQNRRVELK